MANQQLKHLQDYEGKQIQGTRDYQEDDFGFDASHPGILLALLADGMGGYVGGDTASSLVIKAFMDYYNPDDEQTTANCLEQSMATANKMLANKIIEKPKLAGMGCTFVGAVLSKNLTRLHWISVGDSPFWLYRHGKLSRLNADHSKRTELQEKARIGQITATEAATHPERNSLTSALTGEPPAKIDNNSKALEPSDILLLASDGLLTLNEPEIERLLSNNKNSAKDLTNRLLGAINRKKRAGQDNTTVLVIKIPPPITLEHLTVIKRPSVKKVIHPTKTSKGLKYLLLGILFLLSLIAAFIAGGKFCPKPIEPNTTIGQEQKTTVKEISEQDKTTIEENKPDSEQKEDVDKKETETKKTESDSQNSQKNDIPTEEEDKPWWSMFF
ncbi:MAG: serine/threonine-protein phosphatase [Thiomargarita sp.]|nr:serine/threonine-protein phosphatase [Thiomargarita sp.]